MSQNIYEFLLIVTYEGFRKNFRPSKANKTRQYSTLFVDITSVNFTLSFLSLVCSIQLKEHSSCACINRKRLADWMMSDADADNAAAFTTMEAEAI